jgi:hypothetical protein
MPSQEELLKDINGQDAVNIPLYAASLGEGDLKTLNEFPEEIQRPVITDRNPSANYKMYVELLTCVHGQLDQTTKKPASLLIFEYRLDCLEESHRFTSVKTSFTFTQKSKHATGIEVLAFAPFRIPKKWNASYATYDVDRKIFVELGASLPVLAPKIGLEQDVRKSYEKEYSSYGTAGRHHARNAVWWYMRGNVSHQEGIPPLFRVAVILGRSNNEAFEAALYLEVHGCLFFSITEGIRHFLRRSDIQDDPINFDPTAEPKGLPIGVDPKNLGALSHDYCLDKLAPVWGLSPFVQ